MTTKAILNEYLYQLAYTYGLQDVATKDSTTQSLTPYTQHGNDIHLKVGRYTAVIHNIRSQHIGDKENERKTLVYLSLYTEQNNELVLCEDELPHNITDRFMDGIHEVITRRERIF